MPQVVLIVSVIVFCVLFGFLGKLFDKIYEKRYAKIQNEMFYSTQETVVEKLEERYPFFCSLYFEPVRLMVLSGLISFVVVFLANAILFS